MCICVGCVCMGCGAFACPSSPLRYSMLYFLIHCRFQNRKKNTMAQKFCSALSTPFPPLTTCNKKNRYNTRTYTKQQHSYIIATHGTKRKVGQCKRRLYDWSRRSIRQRKKFLKYVDSAWTGGDWSYFIYFFIQTGVSGTKKPTAPRKKDMETGRSVRL
jgi:hypothetical protein